MKRPEIWLLGTVLLIAGLLLVFASIAQTVFAGDSTAFDRAIILSLRSASDISDPIGPAWIEEAARDVTSLGSVIVVFMLAGAYAGYLLFARRRAQAMLMLVSVAGGLALNDLLKFIFDRPRPELVLHSARVFTSSFPSGHAALSSVAYLTMAALFTNHAPSRSLRIYVMSVAILFALLVGASRVYLGLHYPTDVLAGWCIGSAWALTCWMVARRLEYRGANHAERQSH
jgi:undecaprenyl-diphosphatase